MIPAEARELHAQSGWRVRFGQVALPTGCQQCVRRHNGLLDRLPAIHVAQRHVDVNWPQAISRAKRSVSKVTEHEYGIVELLVSSLVNIRLTAFEVRLPLSFCRYDTFLYCGTILRISKTRNGIPDTCKDLFELFSVKESHGMKGRRDLKTGSKLLFGFPGLSAP